MWRVPPKLEYNASVGSCQSTSQNMHMRTGTETSLQVTRKAITRERYSCTYYMTNSCRTLQKDVLPAALSVQMTAHPFENSMQWITPWCYTTFTAFHKKTICQQIAQCRQFLHQAKKQPSVTASAPPAMILALHPTLPATNPIRRPST